MTLWHFAGVGWLSRRWRGGGTLFVSAFVFLATAFVGNAQAAGESIYITPPSSAKVGISYSFTVSGYAPQTEQLYFFDDVESCGSSPYVEHAVHNANGDDYTVTGNFQNVSSGWNSPKATTYYVCAYLVDASEPLNPSGGVLAEKFQSFAVQGAVIRHCGSFKYGSDGLPPGPGNVRARGVSCGFARSLAYHGSARGWHCASGGVGILIVCHPNSGGGRLVEFYGE